MRKLTSYLLMSLDGIVEAPNKFVRREAFGDIVELLRETVSEQDAVLMGRKTYAEWSGFWPDSTIEPFATFINNVPKFVVSGTLREVHWRNSTLVGDDLAAAVADLKARPGKTIGVHGSLALVQSLLLAGALDELRVVQFPVAAGSGRRLLEHGGPPVQLDLKSSRATPAGLQFSVYAPHV
jgi:dihydrofolate reductase